AALAQADVSSGESRRGAADDQVIMKRQQQKLCSFQQAARGAEVGGAWGGIAGRVIMNNDEMTRGVRQSDAEDVAGIGEALGRAAAKDFFDPKESEAVIQEDEAEAFLREGLHLRGEQGVDQRGFIHFDAAHLFARQPRSKPKSGDELDGFGGADAFDSREL